MGAKVEVFREQFRQVFTSRDNEVARVVELVVLGKKVNGRCMWGADNVIGSGGRDIGGGDEVMDSGGHSLLVVRHRVGRQRAIEVGFFEVGRGFSFVEVCTAHQFYDDVFAMSETSNGRQGDVKMLGTPVKVEPVDNILADAWKWPGAGVQWDGRWPRVVKQSYSLDAGVVLWNGAQCYEYCYWIE